MVLWYNRQANHTADYQNKCTFINARALNYKVDNLGIRTLNKPEI